MLRPNRGILISLILVAALILMGFTSVVNTPKDKLEVIKKEIPQRWWEGGWDKTEELKGFISLYPNNPELVAEAKYWIACNSRSQGDTDSALAQYQEIIDKYPNCPAQVMQAQFEIAQIYYFVKKDYKAALDGYQKVSSLSPNSWQGQYSLEYIGRCQMNLGDSQKAQAELQKAYDAGRVQAGLAVAEIMLKEADNIPLTNRDLRDAQLKKVLSYYKGLFELYPLEQDQGEVFTQIIDGITKTFVKLDGNLVRANQFINYQKYGRAGKDAALNSPDDLVNPLAEF